VYKWRKPESWALFVWILIGLAPSVLTSEAPHFGRTTMAMPALVVLVALGSVTLWQRLCFRAVRGLIVATVAISILVPIWLYFGVWANDPRVSEAFDIQQFEIAQQLKAAPPGAALYATPLNVGWIHDYWVIEYLLGREDGERYTPFNGTVCTVAPASPPNGARFVVVAAPEADDWRTPAILPGLYANVKDTPIPVPGDRFPMTVYDVTPNSPAQIAKTPLAEFGDLVRLVSYQYSPPTLVSGQLLQLNVVWQTIASSDVPYKYFVHLLGAPKLDGSILYAQRDGEPCARLWHTTSWRPNELLFDTYMLRLPNELPPGNYELEIGWYAEATGVRVPVSKANTTSFRLAEFSVR
jgi:hypothetical protein